MYTDGANVLYDYANSADDMQLRLLTVVISGQVVFRDLIDEYLKRITFDHDRWATELVVPVTPNPVLRVAPLVAGGDPIFMNGGAPLSAVHSRWRGGESVEWIAADFWVPLADINEAIDALWPHQIAA